MGPRKEPEQAAPHPAGWSEARSDPRAPPQATPVAQQGAMQLDARLIFVFSNSAKSASSRLIMKICVGMRTGEVARPPPNHPRQRQSAYPAGASMCHTAPRALHEG